MSDRQRFHVCPKCGRVKIRRVVLVGMECPCRNPYPEMLPATVIVLPNGEPTDEQVERATKAAAQVSRMMRLSGTADRNERSEAAARAVIRVLASPDERNTDE